MKINMQADVSMDELAHAIAGELSSEQAQFFNEFFKKMDELCIDKDDGQSLLIEQLEFIRDDLAEQAKEALLFLSGGEHEN